MSFIDGDIKGKHFKSLGSKVKVMLKYSIYTCSFGVKGLNRALSVSDFLKYSAVVGTGWPQTLENRENREIDEKKFPAWKNQGIWKK